MTWTNLISFFWKKRSKKTYHSKDYYKQKLDQYKDLSGYCNILVVLSNKDPIYINTEIDLIHDRQSLVSQRDALKRYGMPDCKYPITHNSLKIEILFYRIYIGNYKARLELHFTDDKLFYYSYTLPYINRREEQETLNTLKSKYVKDISFDYENNSIVDKNLFNLWIERVVNLKVHYFLNSPEVVQMIMENFDKQEFKKMEVLRKDTSKRYKKL